MLYPPMITSVLLGSLFGHPILLLALPSLQLSGNSSSLEFAPLYLGENTTIQLDLATTSRAALLLYTEEGGPQSAYLQLTLVDELLTLRLDFKSDIKADSQPDTELLLTHRHARLSDNTWHRAAVTLKRDLVTLSVDGHSVTKKPRTPLQLPRRFHQPLYVGGISPQPANDASQWALFTVMFEPRYTGRVRNVAATNYLTGRPAHVSLLSQTGAVERGLDWCSVGQQLCTPGLCLLGETNFYCDCSGTDFVGPRCEIAIAGPTATFSGHGYVSNALFSGAITSSTDVIQLDIRTKRSTCFLFYTGNLNIRSKPNHILLYLRLGLLHLDVVFSDNSHSRQLHTQGGGRFDDNQWHTILVQRLESLIRVTIDGRLSHEHTMSKSADLLWSKKIFLAGIPEATEMPENPVRDRFTGCMKQAHYKADNINLDLLYLANEERHGFQVHGKVTFSGCHDQFSHQPITFHRPNTFLVVRASRSRLRDMEMTLTFRTTELRGLLLYQAGEGTGQRDRDFLALELRWGHLYLLLSAHGEGFTAQVSDKIASDGRANTVTFSFGFNRARVQLNRDPPVTLALSGKGRQSINIGDRIFLGGLDQARQAAVPYQVWSGVLKRGFVGCLSRLKINAEWIDLVGALRSVQHPGQVSEGCAPDLGQQQMCHSQPCQHGGGCSEGWNRFVCDCSMTSWTGYECSKTASTAAFDGTQYVRVDLGREQQTESEEVTLRFRTRHRSGLLFRTANPNSVARDRMELQITDGRIRFILNLGTETKIFKIYDPVNDDRWHTIKILRENTSLTTNLDGKRLHHEIQGNATFLNSRQIIVAMSTTSDNGPITKEVAGLSSVQRRIKRDDLEILGDATPFVGYMMHFTFNGVNYFSENIVNSSSIESNANLGPMIEIKDFPVNFLSEACFASLPPLSLYQRFAVSLWFKTSQRDGVILMNWAETKKDFILLEMSSGFLQLSFNMGRAIQRQISIHGGLHDNAWHQVTVQREDVSINAIDFRVDGQPIGEQARIYVLEPQRARNFDFDQPLYLGGIPDPEYTRLKQMVTIRHGFKGCVASLSVNGERPKDLLRSASIRLPISCESKIVSGCSRPGLSCRHDSCFHGGVCQYQWSKIRCDCQYTSFTGDRCHKVSQTIEFGTTLGAEGYVKVEYKDRTRNTTRDELAFGLETRAYHGTLMYVQATDVNGDFIHIYMTGGRIRVKYDMGRGIHTLEEDTAFLADGVYHRIKLVRTGKSIALYVDDSTMFKDPKGTFGTHFNQQRALWIGYSPVVKYSKYFQGNISGMVFNTLPITDMIWGSVERSYVEVTRFSVVRRSIDFQPNMPEGSPFKYPLKELPPTPNTKVKVKVKPFQVMQQNVPQAESEGRNHLKGSQKKDIIVPKVKCLEQDCHEALSGQAYPMTTTSIVSRRVIIIGATQPPSPVNNPAWSLPTKPPWKDQNALSPSKPGQNDDQSNRWWLPGKSPSDKLNEPNVDPKSVADEVDKYRPAHPEVITPSLAIRPPVDTPSKAGLFPGASISLWLILALSVGIAAFISLVVCMMFKCRRQRQGGELINGVFAAGIPLNKGEPDPALVPLRSPPDPLDIASSPTLLTNGHALKDNTPTSATTTRKKRNKGDVKEWYV